MERKSPNKFKQAVLFCVTNKSDSRFVAIMQVEMRIFLTGMICLALYMLSYIGRGITGEEIGIAIFVIAFSLVGIAISFMTISRSYSNPRSREK